MKDVFKVHTRRIHLMFGGECSLTMKVANLPQAIEILELFHALLPRLTPVDDRFSAELQNTPYDQSKEWTLRNRPAVSVECHLLVRSVRYHNDMYFVRIYDVDGHHEQAFFNHLNIHNVMGQLKKLITRWKKELERAKEIAELKKSDPQAWLSQTVQSHQRKSGIEISDRVIKLISEPKESE